MPAKYLNPGKIEFDGRLNREGAAGPPSISLMTSRSFLGSKAASP
jgi:hypothetical protein